MLCDFRNIQIRTFDPGISSRPIKYLLVMWLNSHNPPPIDSSVWLDWLDWLPIENITNRRTQRERGRKTPTNESIEFVYALVQFSQQQQLKQAGKQAVRRRRTGRKG